MSAIAEPAIVSDDHLAKRNALVLALAQALAGGNSVVIVGTAGIVGGMLADRAFATVPGPWPFFASRSTLTMSGGVFSGTPRPRQVPTDKSVPRSLKVGTFS